MLITIFTANLDSSISTFSGRPNNWYAIRPRDGRAGFRFTRPRRGVHDAQRERGSHGFAFQCRRCLGAGQQPPSGCGNRLLANPSFRLRAADRAHKHLFNDGVFTPAAAKARFLARKETIDLAIIAESARWGDTRRATPYTRNAEWISRVNQIEQSIKIVTSILRAGHRAGPTDVRRDLPEARGAFVQPVQAAVVATGTVLAITAPRRLDLLYA